MKTVDGYRLPDSLAPGDRIQIYFPRELCDLLLEGHRKGREPGWRTIARNALNGAKVESLESRDAA